MKNIISHDAAMAGLYRADPAFAAQLLDAVIADGDQTEIVLTKLHMANSNHLVNFTLDLSHPARMDDATRERMAMMVDADIDYSDIPDSEPWNNVNV